jgi:thiol-disulfide isomerase/thioredoxin
MLDSEPVTSNQYPECNFNRPSFIFCLHPFTFATLKTTLMKKLMPVFILALFSCNICLAQNPIPAQAMAGGQYMVLVERPNEKSLKGIISRELLVNDTSFHWYAESLKGYTPNAAALEGLRKNKDSIQLLTFMGTWCEDSHVVIPKFFALTDAAGFSQDRITLIGVDRQKKTFSHLTEALNIKNVPTIIVLKNGKEIGRVVEFGKYGMFDMELGEIIGSIK